MLTEDWHLFHRHVAIGTDGTYTRDGQLDTIVDADTGVVLETRYPVAPGETRGGGAVMGPVEVTGFLTVEFEARSLEVYGLSGDLGPVRMEAATEEVVAEGVRRALAEGIAGDAGIAAVLADLDSESRAVLVSAIEELAPDTTSVEWASIPQKPTETVLTGVGGVEVDGATISLAERLSEAALNAAYGSTVNVTAAAGNGSTDDSARWIAAINAAHAAGGGVVTAPRGKTYIVQDLPLRERVYFDLRGITLRLPTTPTAPMFRAPTGTFFTQGGIVGGELDGRNATQHGIDFGGINTLEQFLIDDVHLHHFDRGYNSSKDDRFPVLRSSRFRYCNVAAYVTMNHPIIQFCDFRYNDVALQGNINDLYAVGVKFNMNRVGVEPDAAAPGALIQNSQFVACAFGRNTEKGAVVNSSNTFSGCLFYGNNSLDDGLTILGSANVVTGNYFGYMQALGSWGGYCVKFGSGTLDNNVISTNIFRLMSPTGHGIGAEAGTIFRNTLITGNTVRIDLDRKFIALATQTYANSKISGNSVVVMPGTTHVAGDGIIELGSLGGGGSDLVDNTIYSDRGSNPANAIRFFGGGGPSGGAIIANKLRGFTVPIASVNGQLSTARWRANSGYDTASAGTTTVPAGSTTVLVTHGLAFTPALSNIQVTPTNNMGAATKFWVTNTGPSQFTIAVDVAPGGSGATFAWAADTGR